MLEGVVILLPSEISAYIKELYAHNSFMKLCGIQIIDIACGKARVGLKIDPDRHTNLNNKLHGGLLMTLMDNATGIAAASVGKRVVTVSMTVDFIKGAEAGSFVEAEAVISYQDAANVNMSMNVLDENGRMLATGMSCMLAIADFPGIPDKW